MTNPSPTQDKSEPCVQRDPSGRVLTTRPEINSNDFGRFVELLSRFEFEFCRRGN